MPFLIPIAATIAAAIMAAIAAVVAAIVPIVIFLGAAIAAVAAVVVGVTTAILSALAVAFTWFGSMVVVQIVSLVNWAATNISTIYFYVAEKIGATLYVFQQILQSVQFKVILSIHNIVYVVSPQYRSMMKQVYGAISKASTALGLGSTFLTLAIQNTRNLVLDVTSMFGQKYDLGQVSWLGTLNNYLNHFNTHASKYQNNPEALFWDLAELIERPAQDAKGAFQQGMILTLEQVVTTTSMVVNKFSQIGIDIETLYDDLPAFIRNAVPDPGAVFWTNLDGFMTNSLGPVLTGLSTEIELWKGRLETAQTTVSDLVDDLRRPGTMMAKVDTLGTQERHAQEDLMAEITSRRLNRLLTDLQPTFTFASNKLEANARLPIPPPSVSPLLSYEHATASVPAPGAMVPRRSWFVGDF